jgi:dolichol-phosphate mannosyltransferase
MTIWVAMPAFNEAPRLPSLLDRWVAVLGALDRPYRFVFVDDGSADDTPRVASSFAAKHPVDIITHAENRGLGASIRDAMRFVADYGGDEDVLVMMDADGTQPPELLPEMLSSLEESGCDVVIASRYRAGASVEGLSAFRRLMSFGARLLFQLVFPIPGVRDYTCGYRAYRVAVIRRAFAEYGERFCDRPGFDCTADVLLRLAELGARFEEVPMELRYAEKAASSRMRVGVTVLRTAGLVIRRRLLG